MISVYHVQLRCQVHCRMDDEAFGKEVRARLRKPFTAYSARGRGAPRGRRLAAPSGASSSLMMMERYMQARAEEEEAQRRFESATKWQRGAIAEVVRLEPQKSLHT